MLVLCFGIVVTLEIATFRIDIVQNNLTVNPRDMRILSPPNDYFINQTFQFQILDHNPRLINDVVSLNVLM